MQKTVRPTALACSLLFVFALSVPGCGSRGGDAGGAPGGARQAIVLITIDGLRPERLATFGGSVASPVVDSLVSRGAVYPEAWAPVPMTRPSLASLHTSQGPDRIAVRDDVSDRLSPDAPTIAGRLRERGWRTAAFVGSPLAGFGSGLEAGFDLYDAPEELEVGPGRFLPNPRPATEVVRNARTWLESLTASDRVFAWIHLADVQGAVARGTSAADRLARYDAALGGAMAALESLGAWVDARDGEAFFAGAYGTLLGEDGAFGSSYWLREETLRSVIVWRGGRSPTGLRDLQERSLLDLAPTILASAEAEPLPAAEGFDLAVGDPPERTFVAWTWAPDDEAALPTVTAERRGERWSTEEWSAARSFLRPATPRPRSISERTRAGLTPHDVILDPSSDAGSPVPQDRNAFYSALSTTRAAFVDGDEARAGRYAAEFLGKYPGNLAAITINLFLASMAPPGPQKDSLIRDALRRFPLRGEVLHWIGHEAFAAGDPVRGEAFVRAAAEIGPADADHWYDLACARALQGDRDGALDYLTRSIESGYRNWGWIEQDPDLAAIRGERRFAELLAAHGR